jgi:hypothetical protein
MRNALFDFTIGIREKQYKYHFKKWGIKKHLCQTTKRKLLDKGQQRAAGGKRTRYALDDKEIDAKRLLREARSDSKRDIILNPSATGQVGVRRILSGFGAHTGASMSVSRLLPVRLFQTSRLISSRFLAWNKPYGAMTANQPMVWSPAPNNPGSPVNAPSPFSQAIAMKRSVDRARLFVEGNFDSLLRSMNREETMWVHMSVFDSANEANLSAAKRHVILASPVLVLCVQNRQTLGSLTAFLGCIPSRI